MEVVLHPGYFPNCATFALLAQTTVTWEVHDNYQKQTFRNRTHICTDRGRHMLNIPIEHVGGDQGRQKYCDVRLKNEYAWQRQHLKTLQTAYRTSPFFEFYEDDLVPFFERQFTFLLDMNFEGLQLMSSLLGFELSSQKTAAYRTDSKPNIDARFMIGAKQDLLWDQQTYTQVFDDRHGFIPNASVLDLLFNEGPNTLSYLKNQDLSFLDGQ